MIYEKKNYPKIRQGFFSGLGSQAAYSNLGQNNDDEYENIYLRPFCK